MAFVLGTLFGGVQVARGAHFVSHVLWSAWMAWGINVTLLSASAYWPRRGASFAVNSAELLAQKR